MSSNDLFVKQDDTHKRVFFLAKEALKEKAEINVVANYKAAFNASRAANTLASIGYASLTNIQTVTEVFEGRRRIKVVISLKKSADFDKIYAENEEKRKQFIEQRESEQKKQI